MSNHNESSKKSTVKIVPFHQNFQPQGPSTLVSKWDDPEYIAGVETIYRMRESNKLDWITASKVTSTPKKWAYAEWLLVGELTCLVGSPNVGKTTFVCALVAGLSIGESYLLHPALTPTESGHVIIINREDDREKSLIPRLEAAGANLEMVHFIGGKTGSGDDSPFSLSNERDIIRLMGLAEHLGNNVSLLIVDPIYFAVDGDQNSDQKARAAYERLTALSKRLGCAILGVAHTVRNAQGKDALERVAGPPALRQVPRALMLLSKISNGPSETGGTHVLVHAKNNEGKMDGGFEYCLTPVELPRQHGKIETIKFVVTQQLFGSPEDILEQADRGITGEKTSKSDCAVKFLQTALKDGPKLWVEIEKLAKEADVKKGTLMNAKTFLKIDVRKVTGNQGRSEWRLPGDVNKSNSMD